jgi:hypothetical protein
MVLGLRTKTRKDSAFHVDFNILIQEISPWPPSESLKSLRSVVLFWENGERNSGKTSTVAPSIGSGSASGKIEFNEFITLQADFQKEGSSKSGKWQKNLLELNLYEPRRDKLKGQHLGTATLDLAEHAMFHEDSSVPVPLNSRRSFKSNAQPMVYLRIQPLDGDNSSVSSRDALSKEASVDKDSKEFVSATMSEEYTEDTEFASFTDDDEEEVPYPHRSGGTVPTGSNRSQESLKVKEEFYSKCVIHSYCHVYLTLKRGDILFLESMNCNNNTRQEVTTMLSLLHYQSWLIYPVFIHSLSFHIVCLKASHNCQYGC